MEKKRVNRFLRGVLTALVCSCAFKAVGATEVHVEKAGTLSTLITSVGKELKVTGSINGTDVKFLREQMTTGTLATLDLSEVKIVAGGEAYYENYKTEADVMGKYMFVNCKKLRSITLPTSVYAILERAFQYTALTKADIPNNVTRLGYGAFSDCSSLSTIVIGSRVANIEQGCFYNSAVSLAYVKPMTPPALGPYIFTTKPTIRVYTDAVNDYKDSNWAQYGTIGGRLENVYPKEDDGSNAVNTLRETFFEDAACTTLKAEYQAMSDEELTAAMTEAGMPDFMIPIALKLKNQQWAAYEQDFRIHSYGAYSDASYWNSLLKSTGGSYMGNPTGIYSEDTNPLYVFVDEDVPADATLYIAGCEGKNVLTGAKLGTKLTKGFNIVNGQKNVLYYILYTADTKSKTKTLDQWPPIKIHIEGGKVNGYYDVSRHSDSDYQALLRAATHEFFTIRGGQSLFNFNTKTYKSVWPKSIDKSICWFDSLTVWEKELMGFCESVASGRRAGAPFCLRGGEAIFPIYYNNPNFAIQGVEADAGWANSSAYRTSYNSEGCVSSAFCVTRADLDDWCAAHECGHNNQGVISLEGGTEVSNNLFSNVIRYLDGLVTSEGSSLAVVMQEHARHEPFYTRSLESQMRMYYQLYLYFHQAQKNMSFYPELFRELRRDPLGTRYSDTKNTCLKFVRKVCELAQEDLTDFFTAWGFFEPVTNLTVNDYGTHTMTVTQADINRTLAEIGRYPKNRTLLFIEDRVDYVLTSDFLTTAGKKRRNSDRVGKCGNVGQFTTYLPGQCEPSSYTYIQADSLYAMSGTGGVGFLVLNSKGKMVTASNAFNFSIPTSAGDDFTIYSVDADGTLHETTKAGEGYQMVHLDAAGTLPDLLSDNVLKATIGGKINGTDIKYIRQLINEGNLMAVDLSDARVISGGAAYYENYRTSMNVIGSYAFYQCANLISIGLPTTTTSIAEHAFTKSGLRELRVPDNVTSIGLESFGDCGQLGIVVLGSKLKSIAQGVFYNSSVHDVYVKALTPPSLGPYIFTSKPTIHVYAKSLSAYQSSNWAQYGTIVGDLDEHEDIINAVQQPQYDVAKAGDEGAIYDLSGRKVYESMPPLGEGRRGSLPKGIYIRDGKKFIVKP